MNNKTLEKFKKYFTQMKFNNNSALEEIYSDNIVFTDLFTKYREFKTSPNTLAN